MTEIQSSVCEHNIVCVQLVLHTDDEVTGFTGCWTGGKQVVCAEDACGFCGFKEIQFAFGSGSRLTESTDSLCFEASALSYC